jgi:hypothetical protein
MTRAAFQFICAKSPPTAARLLQAMARKLRQSDTQGGRHGQHQMQVSIQSAYSQHAVSIPSAYSRHTVSIQLVSVHSAYSLLQAMARKLRQSDTQRGRHGQHQMQVSIQSAYSQHTVSMQPAYSQHTVSIQSAYSQHTVSIQSAAGHGPQAAPVRHPRWTPRPAPDAVSIQSAYSQHAVSIQSAYSRHTVSIQLVSVHSAYSLLQAMACKLCQFNTQGRSTLDPLVPPCGPPSAPL